MVIFAYTGATIDPIVGDIIEDGTILVKDGTILAIGSDLDTSDADNVIDCSGKYITPGLIDAHSHVGLFEEGAGREHSDGNEMTDPITPYLRSMDAIFPEDMGFDDAREGGVTTMGITPGSGNLVGGQTAAIKSIKSSIIEEMIIRQPAGVKMALGENPRRVYSDKEKLPTTRMGSAYKIRAAFYEAIDYRSEWQTYEEKREKEMNKPQEERKPLQEPKFDMGKEILLKILSGTIPVRCHSHRADDIATAVRLSEEFGYRLIIDHATEAHKIPNFLVERDVAVVVGPLMTSRSKRELKDRTLKTPAIMMDAGGLVCITTDAPVIPIYMLRESVIMSVREGLDRDRALETVTINPAKVMGIDERVGSLEEGKDADMVIWSGDPLDAATIAEKTIIDGQVQYSADEVNSNQ